MFEASGVQGSASGLVAKGHNLGIKARVQGEFGGRFWRESWGRVEECNSYLKP